MNRQHILFYWRFKVLLIFLILCWAGKQQGYAQYYPIHATVQWPSPQSPYLSDYYSGSRDRLIVNLLNRDLQQPLLFARLRIRIKSTGFLATSREEINYPMLELSANVPTRLTNIDLSPYLQPQNLQINGSLRNGQLPTGYTEFSVQVVDYYTGRTLSAWHTGRSYLDVKKPPILNFPEKDARIGVTEPLYLRFQWMPRHQGLAGTEYEFVLKELPNNGAAPQSAFAYGNEIYRVRTRHTTLNYTHLEPILFPNRCYAWQVQAIARDGVDEVGMFENGGYSEINWFYLNDNCQAPTGLRALPRFAKVDLSWNKVIGTTGYIVECRPKTKLNTYEWSRTQIAGEHLTLSQLKLGWTYEWRVGTLCTDNRPVFSGVSEFTLSKQNEELLADCGKEPVRKDLSQEPNLRIKAGDIVTIGDDYPMTITEVVPLGDGWYSGRGKTRLKTIIDAPVALRFDRLRINVDNFQIDGTVEASYDEKKGKIANLDYVDDGGKDIKPATIRMREHKLDLTLPDIPQFTYNHKTGELETTDADGNPQTIKVDVPENTSYESIFPILVTDNKGNTYQISPSEQGTEGTTNGVENENKDEKIELNCERVDRVGDFNTESLSSKYGYIHFKPGEGKYAFDDGQEKWYKKSVKVDRFYKPFAKGYIAPWKLVPTGENDVVTAKYEGSKNIDLKKVHFVSEPNTAALPASLNETEQTWTITLKSVSAGASYDVFAVYEGVVIGKLRVVSYDKHQHKITLVPINEVKLDKIAIEQGLNAIYNPVGVQLTVDIDESMRGNYDWEVESEKDGLLSTVGKSFWGYDKELKESTEMLNLQKTYQQAAGTLDGVYLFVLNGATGFEGQKGDLLGEMPRKSRFGYIFAGNSPNTEEIVHTIAHELGHGIFTLQHTFDAEYGKGTQGTTNNLLDYTEKGKELAAFQWNVMANPAVFTRMDKAEDREKVEGATFILEQQTNFVTPDGRIVTLPKDAIIYQYCIDINVTNRFSYAEFPNGALYGFKVGNNYYVSKENLSSGGHTFLGYFLVRNGKYTDSEYPISKQEKGRKNIVFLNYTAPSSQPHNVEFVRIKGFDFNPNLNGKFVYVDYRNKFSSADIVEFIDFSASTCSSGAVHERTKGNHKYKGTGKQQIDTIENITNGNGYKLVVYQNNETGFYEVEIKLYGKVKNATIKAQKAKIEQELKRLAEEKLNQLGGLNGKVSVQQRLVTDDGGEFWIKEMNGRQWLEAIGALGTSIWETGQLPQEYWNKDKDYNKSNIHIPPTFAGVADGVVDEVTDYPQLIKLGYDVVTKKEVREALWESVKGISVETIKDAAIDFYEKKKANYTSDKSYIVHHTVSKDAVAVASVFIGGGISKGLKNTTDKVNNGIELVSKRIKKEAREKATKKFLETIDPKILERLKNTPGFDKVLEDMAQHWKKFKGEKFLLEYFSKKIENLQGSLCFEVSQALMIDGKEVARIYDATVEYAGKITKYELKNWTGWYPASIRKQFIRDIQSVEKLDELKWVFNTTSGVNKGNLKEKIISTLKKNDGKPIEELEKITLEQVKKIFPKEARTINRNNRLDFLMKKLEDDQIFNQIFEVVE